MNEILTFMSALGHVTNVTKTLFQAHTEVERDTAKMELNGALIDLQSKVFDIQARYQKLQAENDELKAQLTKYQKWETESQTVPT